MHEDKMDEYGRALCVRGYHIYREIWDTYLCLLEQSDCISCNIRGVFPSPWGWLLGPLGLSERLLAKALRMTMNLLDPEVHLSVSGILREPSLTHAKHSY